MDCIIDTTPVWNPVLASLECLRPGGRLVINAIRKHDDIPDKPSLAALDYPTHLWLEKEVVSVANITRQDVTEFLALAATIPIQPETICCPLESANEAIIAMKTGPITAARVLTIS